MEEEKESLRE